MGSTLKVNISAPMVVLHINDINDSTCTINKNITELIIVFANSTLSSMIGCNNDPMGETAALSRVAQKMGALGLIIASVEKVLMIESVF